MPRCTISGFAQVVRAVLQVEDARFDLLVESAALICFEDGYPTEITSLLEQAAEAVRQARGWEFIWFEPGDDGFTEDA
jgi:hypothetical protein